MTANRQVGQWGEDAALAYLRGFGYSLLERNFRCRSGEVDLIMQDGREIVFVEVKTRRSLRYGAPQEAVGWSKQQKVRTLAQYYLQKNGLSDIDTRFDVVAIMLSAGGHSIEHLQGVF
jgi:putative endonuclease